MVESSASSPGSLSRAISSSGQTLPTILRSSGPVAPRHGREQNFRGTAASGYIFTLNVISAGER
jgi:hypothetical protein